MIKVGVDFSAFHFELMYRYDTFDNNIGIKNSSA